MSSDGLPRTQVVLLVDDDLRTTRRLAEMLREDGLTVEIARDGAAAIARFTQQPVPDALVTELTTAHADAAAVSRFGRSQRPGLPVLVVTGYPNLLQAEAFGSPPPLLFTKPVDYSKLRDALLRVLPDVAASERLRASEINPAGAAEPALESQVKDATGFPGDTLSGAQAVRALRRP
ncbi:MAG: response regulator [Pseudomonadota bacterium]